MKLGTVILHSRADDVIPFADSEELVKDSGVPPYMLIEIGNDHRLADPESLDMMLEACLIDDDEPVKEAAGDILEQDWTGRCYAAALKWAGKNQEWILVHGTVLSEKVGKRIEHAWCELGDLIVDLAMPVGARIVERERYYRVIKPEVNRKYSAVDALLLSIKTGHSGPWDESERLEN